MSAPHAGGPGVLAQVRQAIRVVWPPRRLALLFAALTVLLVATAPPANAIPNPFDDVCNNDEAPTPAAPTGEGSWIINTNTIAQSLVAGGHVASNELSTSAGDPFTDPGVTFAESYGVVPQWWSYDNGCTGQITASLGASAGNTMLQLTGTLPNWSEAMIDLVIVPDAWVGAFDQPVAKATQAATDGVWTPWIGVAMILVALLVMLRSRSGQIATAITAFGWAIGVIVAASFLMQYPIQSVHLVDTGVQTAVTSIATGFSNDAEEAPPACAPAEVSAGMCELPSPEEAKQLQATNAVGQQMDHIVRETQYRTWLDGVFGDADSAIAKEYGPRVFRATHMTWGEYEQYLRDPEGDGAEIIKDKKEDFKDLAAEIKSKDSAAYDNFRGENWGARLTLVLVNALVMVTVVGFLVVSGLAILLAFGLIRILVPFGPALGVLFAVETTRPWAIAVLKKVVGPLVMGPLWFLGGLLLLRFDAAILASDLWWIVKILFIGVLAWVMWKLLRPASYAPRVPGMGHLKTAMMYLATRRGAADGLGAAQGSQPTTPQPTPDGANVGRPSGQVYTPHSALPAPSRRPEESPRGRSERLGDERSSVSRRIPAVPPDSRRLPGREASTPIAGERVPSTRTATLDGGAVPSRMIGHEEADRPHTRGTVNATNPEGPIESIRAERPSEAVSKAHENVADPESLSSVPPQRAETPPRHAAARPDEANMSFDPGTGEPVFVIYHPAGSQRVRADDWHNEQGSA